MSLGNLRLYTDDIHQPFYYRGGSSAALLIHGFPGTPSEMRPLALQLHQAGWTVQGLLLPGFGPQIGDLFEQNYDIWLQAIYKAIQVLQRDHETVLLVGYSMGGALSIQTATHLPLDALILVAPFWRLGTVFHKGLWQMWKRIFPNPQPLKKADFANPKTRQLILDFFPDIDLDSAAAQQTLRQLRVPAHLLDQIFLAGSVAKRSAVQITMPTLILQGQQDEAVQPKYTRQLIQPIPAPIQYLEVAADHDILNPEGNAWPQVSQTVVEFAARFQTQLSGT